MRISTKGDYGVRALVELAKHWGDGPLQSAEIARCQGIPEPYLDQLLTTMRRAGFVLSVRGPQGGHTLSRHPSDINLLAVVEALEGSLAPIGCLDHAECTKPGPCAQRDVWAEVRRAVEDILRGVTIEELAAKEQQPVAAPRYYI